MKLHPLLVPEEEGLLPVSVVMVRNEDRSAKIVSIDILFVFGDGGAEVVAGVEIVVAQVLPGIAVELASASRVAIVLRAKICAIIIILRERSPPNAARL